MPVAKITRQGLVAIALAVGLLWGCVIAERVAQRRAWECRARVLRDMQKLRLNREQPVSAPIPAPPHRAPVTVG
jgi:hypothetical protein